MVEPNTLELNTIDAVNNAADKRRMKQCFDTSKVKTAKWWNANEVGKNKKFPVVAKHRFGSRGTGVYKLDTKAQLDEFLAKRKGELDLFIFEEYKPYNREYRMHVWEEGCFYSCRKARKHGIPKEEKWKFNYGHTVWLREDNKNFNRPACWNEMVAECVKAVKACGLVFGGCDVKVNKEGTKFFMLEINSAPSFGDLTTEKYVEMLPKMARKLHEQTKAAA